MRNRFVTTFAGSLAIGAGVFTTGLASAATIGQWTFETVPPTTAGPIAADVGTGSASASHADGATVYSNPVGNGSNESYSSDHWGVNDYYQFSTSATGFNSITIQWDQVGSSTGPRDFQLAWSTNGTTFTNLGAGYQVLTNAAPNAWSSGTPILTTTFGPIAAPAALDNAATIYFRLIDTSTTSTNGATVAAAGTNRVDNVIISGTPVPEPTSLAVLGISALALSARRRRD